MAKYCVIGSNSFSGQDFVDLLLDDPNREVIGISRSAEAPSYMLRYRARPDLSRFRFHQFDMNREAPALAAFLNEEKPDYIVNFAAQSEVAPSWEYPDHWFETNTVALAKLVNNLRRQTWLKRYLHISSPEAYGNCVGTVTEDTPDNPSTPYAASKSAADMLIGAYQKQYGFPAMYIRATNVYGARQQLFKIIPRTAILLKRGQRIQLHGGGVAVKSYIHIRDVSRGELAVLHGGEVGQRYHLSPDGGVAVRDVVNAICKQMGRRFEDSVAMAAERPGQDAAYVISSEKARHAFGWRPEMTFQDGIADVIAWIEANWPKIADKNIEYVHKA
jgi:dTDP-glucose 4,6-dehydratase